MANISAESFDRVNLGYVLLPKKITWGIILETLTLLNLFVIIRD